MKKFTFVLKDKGTPNQGWWLKIHNADELCAYYETFAPTRMGKVFENFVYGKEWNTQSNTHAPHLKEAQLTDAIVRYGSIHNYNIIQAIKGFQLMVVERQLDSIKEYGAIYVNRVGGYHSFYSKEEECAIVRRNEIVFPNYNKKDIKISKFPYGNHWYAYVGDLEVQDGDVIKWNTYEEAYKKAEEFLGGIKDE